MDFINGKDLLKICNTKNLPISEVTKLREVLNTGVTEKDVIERMKKSLEIMKACVKSPLEQDLKSMGGLIGGEAKKLDEYFKSGKSICGSVLSRAIKFAVGVLEVNCSMGVIVASPTAGGSGVLPAALLSLKEEFNLSEDEVLKGLFNASGIGYLIMKNASVSGAEAGCQAEVGSASAMAASAIVEVMGGSPEQCFSAASIALQNLLGLICDPVGGLVEIPCQTRNAMGVSNALICAEMALSGIKSFIPLDEMITTMYTVGKSLPFEHRETALGGCAITPSAHKIFKNK